MLPETDLKGARIVAERLNEAVTRVIIEGPNGRLKVVSRVGGSVFPNERIRTSEDLLREANRSFRELREVTSKVVFDA